MDRMIDALVRYGVHPDDALLIASRWHIGETPAMFLRRYAEAFHDAADEFSPATRCERRSTGVAS